MLMKVRRGIVYLVLIASALLVPGCKQSGPKALLQGEKLIREGKFSEALQPLEQAGQLMPNNPQVWNHLGLAYHNLGNVTKAAEAYQKALSVDKNLHQIYYNLGNLYLESNRLNEAINSLSSYVLVQPNQVEGWAKLSTAFLRAGRYDDAEKTITRGIGVSPQNPELHNNLGLVHLQRRKAREALQAFTTALEHHPGYAPALLNQAIVAHYYLPDKKVALEKYKAYLDSQPGAPNVTLVREIVAQLEAELKPTVAMVPAVPGLPQLPEVEQAPQTNALPEFLTDEPPLILTNNTYKVAVNLRAVARDQVAPVPDETSKAAARTSSPEVLPANTQARRSLPKPEEAQGDPVVLVPLPQEPEFKPARDIVAPREDAGALLANSQPAQDRNRPLLPPMPAREPEKRGFFSRLFGRDEETKRETTPLSNPTAAAPAPRGQKTDGWSAAPATVASSQPPRTQPEPPVVQREPEPRPVTPAVTAARPQTETSATNPARTPGTYPYAKELPAGESDPGEAQKHFAEGARSQAARQLDVAINSYKLAIEKDPRHFQSYYNLGLAAYQRRDLPLALAACERAVQLKPGDTDARYNFALALRDASYYQDAANELREVVTDDPDNVRAHLTLANLYSQRLNDVYLARRHYTRVLELDPKHSQAANIRHWLSKN